MPETNRQRRASELAQELEDDASRLTESYQGDGTTNQPIIEYLEEDEKIEHIFTAAMKSIAVNHKGSGETLNNDGEPTYIITDSKILGIMPKKESDDIYEIPFNSIEDVKNNFGWTKWRIEIVADNDTYHLWISASDNEKAKINEAKDYLLKKAENDIPKTLDESDDEGVKIQKSETELSLPEAKIVEESEAPITSEESEFLFTANIKGISIDWDDKKEKLKEKPASDKESVFNFTRTRFIASIPQESTVFLIDVGYNLITDFEFKSGFTKNRIDLKTSGRTFTFWTKDNIEKDAFTSFLSQKLKDDTTFIGNIDEAEEEEEVPDDIDEAEEEEEVPDDIDEAGVSSEENIDFAFTAEKKGMKIIEEDGETHLTSNKNQKSSFEFTKRRFVATVPQESGKEVISIEYDSVDNIDYSSGFRKSRIDISGDEKIYRFWTKDSIDRKELMSYLSDKIKKGPTEIENLLDTDENISHSFHSKEKGMKIIDRDNPENTQHIKPSEWDESTFTLTSKRFLALIPQKVEIKEFSLNYDSIIDVGFSDGLTKNRIDLHTNKMTYKFWVRESTTRKEIVSHIYEKIRHKNHNKLAKALEPKEKIKYAYGGENSWVQCREGGNKKEPNDFQSKILFTDKKFVAYIPNDKDRIYKEPYSSFVDYEVPSGITEVYTILYKSENSIFKFASRTSEESMTGTESQLESFLRRNSTIQQFLLVGDGSKSGTLKVEGWTDGSSDINANVDASSKSKGQSFGVQGGPFFASKTASKSSIKGDISGEITDNTYTAEIKRLKIYKQNLTLKSGVELDIHLSEIENVFKQQNGLVIEVAGTTFRMGDLPSDAKVSEAVSYIKDHMTSSEEGTESPSSTEKDEDKNENKDEDTDSANVDTAEKIRELKDLHEDGILTDEEFETKKEELLDDF